MGTSSIKKNSILYERNIFNSFINSAFKNNYKIIYIKDEAHIGLKKDNKVNFNKLENILFNKTFSNLGISATLPKEIEPDVILEERDVISDNLIKNDCYINHNIINSEVNYKELLVETLNQFKILKKQYSKLNINPALLIQISSENQLNKVEEIEEITKIINKQNLKWCVWLSGSKPNSNSKTIKYSSKQEIRKHLNKNNSEIDVIIFKTALATGWDIPRACILLQISEVNSETLNEQTVGRIRRNPLILNLDDAF